MTGVRHIALVLLLLPATLMAQSVEVLLTRMSAMPEGPEQLALLASITRTRAQEKAWEEALELAELGASKARELDLPGTGAEFELVMAQVAAVQNDRERRLAHGLRAFNYSLEADPGTHARCAMFLAQAYMDEGLTAKAQDYAQQALATRSLSKADRRTTLLLRARALFRMHEDEQTEAALTEVTNLSRMSGDEATLLSCLGLRVAFSQRLNDLPAAINAENERLELVRGTERGIVLNNLGELYARMEDHTKAHEFFGEAATWLGNEPELYARTLVNSAIAYGRQKHYSMAEVVIENAIGIIGSHNSGMALSPALQVKAGILLLAGRFTEAMLVARQAMDDARRMGNTDDELASLELLSRIAMARGALVEKQRYDTRAAELRLELGTQQDLRARLVSEQENALHRQERDITSMTANEQRERLRTRQAMLAAENQSKELGLVMVEKQLQESQLREEALGRERAQQELMLLQNAMAEERQQRELKELQDERTVQMLQLNKIDLERKEKENGMIILQRQNQLLEREGALIAAEQKRGLLINRVALAAVVLMACTAAFFFWLMRKVKGKNRVIRTQVDHIAEINAQLSDKNADFLSSIKYAQNIQQAIIPTEEQLRAELPDSFLYYRPRDIVSGDLPFVRKVGDRLFIATIDCTGHGVPAAMLSFMAYYNLNDIISTHVDFGVSDILFLLHQRIQAAVHGNASNHTLSDGMDITLVELDLDRRVLWYSGAQNSLLHVRDGECHRIKGDKCSIGDPSGQCTAGFRAHRLDLRPSDRVYLYSDGLIHQFGGSNGRKKFSNAQLMRVVGDLADRSAHEIGTHLNTMHQEWQGDQPQTDDIVLIGFSINGHAAVKAA